jgi:hypothetical protein
MKRRIKDSMDKAGNIFITLLLLLFFTSCRSKTSEVNASIDHSSFDKILRTYVNSQGYVDYKGLKANRYELDNYVSQLAKVSPVSHQKLFPTRQSQLTYWINAYNAFTLQGVINHYPTESVQKIYLFSGFFWRLRFTAGGETMSLYYLENSIIRKQFNDPRIHFAIVCASEGCPRLADQAYMPEDLDRQLDAQAVKFINEERNVKIDLNQNQLVVSKIFEWYKDDFVLPTETITSYIERYLSQPKQAQLQKLKAPKIVYQQYDWRINDQARQDSASK